MSPASSTRTVVSRGLVELVVVACALLVACSAPAPAARSAGPAARTTSSPAPTLTHPPSAGVAATPSSALTVPSAPSVTTGASSSAAPGVGCPPEPVSLAALLALDAAPGGPLSRAFPPLFETYEERALACFGGRTLTVVGYVAWPGGLGGSAPFSRVPDWLYAGWYLQPSDRMVELGPSVRAGAGPFLPIAVPAALGSCGADWRTDSSCPFSRYLGRWVRVSGHFDDPAASTCRVSSSSPTANPASIPSEAQVVEICRSVFVLSGVEPVST